jgi:hypothetical protein
LGGGVGVARDGVSNNGAFEEAGECIIGGEVPPSVAGDSAASGIGVTIVGGSTCGT